MNEEVREDIRADIKKKILEGEPVGGQVLPKNPVRIEVRRKSAGLMQVRVIYSDQAPYYFNVGKEELCQNCTQGRSAVRSCVCTQRTASCTRSR